MSEKANKLRLDFGNLPLVEAAVRASLSESVPLTYSVVNAIAQSLGKSFPTLTEPKQIELAPGAGPSTVEFGPSYLPGAVYGGHDAGLFVSLHPQV
ncbi:MAG: hypothetical protein IID37_17420, partial [Planctomycetes bacterium]|nr:hypothetical protein [Planctomycetota bacterium]